MRIVQRGHPSHFLLFIFITSCWYFSRTFLPDRMLLRQKLSFWFHSITAAMSSAAILSIRSIMSKSFAIFNETFRKILLKTRAKLLKTYKNFVCDLRVEALDLALRFALRKLRFIFCDAFF